MALIPLLAIAKLNLLLSCRNSTCNPMVTCLILPFLIRLSFSYQRMRHTYSDFVYAFHLFTFQLGRIAARADQALPDQEGGNNRWQRAVRLVLQRLGEATVSSSAAAMDVEDSLHTLSMLAL